MQSEVSDGYWKLLAQAEVRSASQKRWQEAKIKTQNEASNFQRGKKRFVEACLSWQRSMTFL